MRISEDVLRYMTIRLDELSKGPSPIIDKSRRDDEDEERSDRFDRGDRSDRGDRAERPDRTEREVA